MKISNITFEENKHECILSADVRLSRFRTNKIFFSVPMRYRDFIFTDASPFLVGSLLRCTKLGENLEIHGGVSQKLYNNVTTIIEILDELEIVKKKNEITVTARDISLDVHGKPAGIGCFFSGGVDSFYTFLKNKDQGKEKITHLILVHGFDIPLWNIALFKTVHSRMQIIAKYYGVELISVKTNIKEISDPYVEWGMAHGGAIAATALFLRRGLRRVYIASSNSWDQLFPMGTHPYMDYLWGTESLELVHDGNEANRAQKVKKYIAFSQIALQNIRVCYNNFGNVYNCGKCEKCLRTMVELTVAGVWDKASGNFKAPFDLKNMLLLENNPTIQRHFGASLKELEQNGGDEQLRKTLRGLLDGKSVVPFAQRVLKRLSSIDKKYTNGRLFLYAWQAKKRISWLLTLI